MVGDLRDCSGNVHERVDAVEEGDEFSVTVEEP